MGAATSYKLGAHLNLSHKWIEDKLRILYDAEKIYISDYERRAVSGPPRNVYSIRYSDEVDAVKPPRKTASQRMSLCRKRRKAKEILNVWSS